MISRGGVRRSIGEFARNLEAETLSLRILSVRTDRLYKPFTIQRWELYFGEKTLVVSPPENSRVFSPITELRLIFGKIRERKGFLTDRGAETETHLNTKMNKQTQLLKLHIIELRLTLSRFDNSILLSRQRGPHQRRALYYYHWYYYQYYQYCYY